MIFVNNKKIDSNVAVSDTSKIKIYTKDGAKVPLKEETKLWMFYKPRGLVCSVTDQENRPTIFQYLREKTSLKIDHLISVVILKYKNIVILKNV
jgi:23S rRNA pseudouridine2605 synthase